MNFGYKKTLPHILGITFGFSVMIILIGLGLGSVFKSFSVIHHILKYAGATYLLYLAWKIATFSSFDKKGDRNKPFTFWQAVIFQWVNPKAWVITVGAITGFSIAIPAAFDRDSHLAASELCIINPINFVGLVKGQKHPLLVEDPASVSGEGKSDFLRRDHIFK